MSRVDEHRHFLFRKNPVFALYSISRVRTSHTRVNVHLPRCGKRPELQTECFRLSGPLLDAKGNIGRSLTTESSHWVNSLTNGIHILKMKMKCISLPTEPAPFQLATACLKPSSLFFPFSGSGSLLRTPSSSFFKNDSSPRTSRHS